jgi:hypothetical protein
MGPANTYMKVGFDHFRISGAPAETPYIEMKPGIYPNPTTGSLHLQLAHTILELYVVDMAGKTVMKNEPAAHVFDLDLSKMAAGVYHIIMVDESHTRSFSRIVKQ